MDEDLFKGRVPVNFCGLEEQDYDKSKAVVLPVPYEGTVTWLKGTRKGPSSIIDASMNMEIYDIELDADFTDVGVFTCGNLLPRPSPEEMVESIKEVWTKLLSDGKFCVMIGGEHSISNGALQALKEKEKEFGKLSVLQIDAHADLRDEYEGTKLNHGCVMRRAREMFESVQVGIRSMSVGESEYIKKENIKDIYYSPVGEDQIDEIVSKLKENVYITIDLDGIDPSEVPGVGTPEPNGLTYVFVLELLKKVFKEKKVLGADLVELKPLADEKRSDFIAALLVYKMIGYKFYLR